MKKNLLFLMVDQMHGQVLDKGNPCITPNLDRLSKSGVKFNRAHTANPVCSPARASIMTGLLPHNHGVTTVTHTVDEDQSNLRTDKEHWAQRLQEDGYKTAYFGKWHVERSRKLEDFGWDDYSFIDGLSDEYINANKIHKESIIEELPHLYIDNPPGYDNTPFYGISDIDTDKRVLGLVSNGAKEYLNQADTDKPWACFVSVIEPHDPFISTKKYYDMYENIELRLPKSFNDELLDKPNIYRRGQKVFENMTKQDHIECIRNYYAMVTEIDHEYGKIIDLLEEKGELENTIIIFTSDHGEALASHGIYAKNLAAFEEIYRIPMIISGPGIKENKESDDLVSSMDLCPTILDLFDQKEISNIDSNSFKDILCTEEVNTIQKSFAEYDGTRLQLKQRVLWYKNLKYIFNGFDYDELYDLDSDPNEMKNLIDSDHHKNERQMMIKLYWEELKKNGDHSIYNLDNNPIMKIIEIGPNA
ncbi:MAG: sulfatase-like hydrolase/transferase [Dehalococcoidia bacterium]|nr:sulfatase-like hydrolase/transferase [Dehalococcoidia bacterium]